MVENMKTFQLKSALILIGTILVMPVFAAAEVFSCEVKNHGPYFLIADKIIFDVDTRTKNVLVADGVLAHYGQMPAAGKLRRYNDKQVIVTWKLVAMNGNEHHDGVSEDFTYKAIVNRKSGRVDVSAYNDPIYQVKGVGTCVSAKSKEEKAQKRPEKIDEILSEKCPSYGASHHSNPSCY